MAARYLRREELCGYARELRNYGHIVACRWLDGSHRVPDKPEEAEMKTARQMAQEDVYDLRLSNTLILFSEEPRSTNSRGGRHVEFGMAYSRSMQIIVVGPRENAFHYLPRVEHYI